jgi:type I restriction enzyme S subunit
LNAWRTVRIAEFCTIGSGSTPSRKKMDRYYEAGTIPWVKSGELREAVIHKTEEHVTEAALKETNIKLVPVGAILLAMYGATVGRLGILGVSASTNQAVCHILPDPKIVEGRYLFHALRNQVAGLIRRGVGGAQPNISQGIIREISLPIPPLSAQRRIVDLLDQAEALRAKRRAALAQLDIFTESIFLDLFGDPTTNSKGWPNTTSLGEIADIVSGVAKGRNLQGKGAREVAYMAVANVQDLSLNLSVIKRIEATEEEIQQYKLIPNDLLLTEGGDPDKLGRGTLWNNEVPECIHQNHIFRVRLTSTDVHPLFLNWLVGSRRGKRYFLRSAKQTTGIASINMTQLREFPMLLPPLALQQEFAKRVNAVEKVKAAHRCSRDEMDSLFASLQHRAFQGRL